MYIHGNVCTGSMNLISSNEYQTKLGEIFDFERGDALVGLNHMW